MITGQTIFFIAFAATSGILINLKVFLKKILMTYRQ